MKKKPPKNGAAPNDLQSAADGLAQAIDDYIVALNGGDPDQIRLARRAYNAALSVWTAALANAD